MKLALPLLLAAALCFVPAGVTHASNLVGVDGITSTVMQEGQSSFSGIALRMRFHPEGLVRNVEILPTIEYWRNSSSLETFGISSSRKDATLGADIRYSFFNEGWEPYVGAGFGLHFVSTKVNAPTLGLVNANDSVTKGGLSAVVGVSVPLTARFQNFFELKYHHVTEMRQLKLNWGLSYNL